MDFIFSATAMSTTNYINFLIQAEVTNQNNGLTIGESEFLVTYNVAAALARQKLIDDHGWSISDGGPE